MAIQEEWKCRSNIKKSGVNPWHGGIKSRSSIQEKKNYNSGITTLSRNYAEKAEQVIFVVCILCVSVSKKQQRTGKKIKSCPAYALLRRMLCSTSSLEINFLKLGGLALKNPKRASQEYHTNISFKYILQNQGQVDS